MGISKYFVATILACSAFGSLHASAANKSRDKKFYVNKSSVEFCEEGIRIKTNNGIVTTKAIHTNKKGAYFYESEAIRFE